MGFRGLLGGLLAGLLGGFPGLLSFLPQHQTNGNSLWGTFQAPKLPFFLTNNPLPFGFPWGFLTAGGSNPYTQFPNTGVFRTYDFTITRGVLSPDGYQKNVLMINGQFPGPLIEANWGDTIQVTVHNQITGPSEGTSLHWHGLLQKTSPWMDGVPAVQQCPIAPGSSFTYQFRADLYGTSWYHSHYSAQYSGGILGPMIIHGPSNANYDIDIGPVFLTDYYHQDYYTVVQEILASLPGGNPRPASDNNLINGKMNFDCSTVAPGDQTKCTNNAGISQFQFTTGKTHRLRLINAGSEGLQRFSIDNHQMTVIANDFVPINPYNTKVVTLGIGQRSDVLVTANQGPANSAFWMRSNISTACTPANQPFALAAIYYDQANTNNLPTSTAWNVPDPGTCSNDDLSLTTPYYSITPPSPSTIRNMDISFEINSTGHFLWQLDGTSAQVDYNSPVLLLADQGNLTYPAAWNVKNFGSNSSVRVIINNPTPASHPLHMHGHNMYVLHEGPGNWDGVSITNPNNPQRRDVQLVRAGGHFVFQIDLDNPGTWPFHCHIAWHVSGGLYSTFLERPSDIIATEYSIPFVLQETCTAWNLFTAGNIVDQIDSGL